MPRELSEIQLGKNIFALFKGGPGMRKTTAAASFPEPYFLDLDRKLISVKKIYPDKKIYFDQFDNFSKVLDELENLAHKCPYRTVVLDSLTSTANMIFKTANLVRGPAAMETDEDGKRQKAATRIMRGKVEMPQIEDYKFEERALIMAMDLMQIIHAQGVNIILVAHVITKFQKDIKTKVETITRQLMTGGKGIAAMLPTMFPEAYHFSSITDMQGVSYVALTQSYDEDWAMTALNLPDSLDFTSRPFYEVLSEYFEKPLMIVGGPNNSDII